MITENAFIKKAKLVNLLKYRQPISLKTCLKELNISRRTFFRYLDELRDSGADIAYCKYQDCYVIKNDFNYFESINRTI